MNRFKFPCDCGRKLAAYEWMVGKLVTCPACGKTITVPTPFQGEEKLHELIESGKMKVRRRRIDMFAKKKRPFRVTLLWTLGIIAGLALLGVMVYFILKP